MDEEGRKAIEEELNAPETDRIEPAKPKAVEARKAPDPAEWEDSNFMEFMSAIGTQGA